MYCPGCGIQVPDGTIACPTCGWHEVIPQHSVDQDPTMRALLPVGRSGQAIAAGYLGLMSPILIFAPPALVFGMLALRDIKQNPEKGGKGRAIFGVIMGSLFSSFLLVLIVLSVVGMVIGG